MVRSAGFKWKEHVKKGDVRIYFRNIYIYIVRLMLKTCKYRSRQNTLEKMP